RPGDLSRHRRAPGTDRARRCAGRGSPRAAPWRPGPRPYDAQPVDLRRHLPRPPSGAASLAGRPPQRLRAAHARERADRLVAAPHPAPRGIQRRARHHRRVGVHGLPARRVGAPAVPPAGPHACRRSSGGGRHLGGSAPVTDDLRRRVAELDWYHTIELAPGVETPGWFDLRDVIAEVPLPTSLAGARVLDVGTFDGFWAFEMERRGAAEVVAIDVLDPAGWDWPAGSDDAVVREIGKRKAQGAGFL